MGMNRVLIVDGHSAIFGIDHFRQIHQTNTGGGREALIRWLNYYNDMVDTAVVVVFDGKQQKRSKSREGNGILVMYSKDGETADSMIERTVASKSEKFDIVVATDDRMEGETVTAFGATAIRIEALVGKINSVIGSQW